VLGFALRQFSLYVLEVDVVEVGLDGEVVDLIGGDVD